MLRSIVVNLLSSINGTQSAPQAALPLVSFMATSPLDSSLTCPCVCVCLSVTSRCFIEMDGRIELVFGTFFRHILHCIIRKFRYLQK